MPGAGTEPLVPPVSAHDIPRTPASPRPATPAVAERAAAGLFGALSALRGKRIFHPRGEGFRADFEVDRPLRRYDGIPLLSERASHPAVARLSRAVGIPPPLPDLLGLAFRIETGPQDFLLVSSGRPPGLRHLLLPTRAGYSDNSYSSVLPYRVGDDLLLVGALPTGPLEYDIAVARLRGPWEPFAKLHLRFAIPDDDAEHLELNPWNTIPGLKPVGPLNGLRRSSYAGSQRGRSAARAEEFPEQRR
jgi:hypothetical protein